MQAFLKAHCVRCHGEKKSRGDVNFEALMADRTDALQQLKTWKAAEGRIAAREMPPEEADQPTEQERAAFAQWYKSLMANLPAIPAPVQVRRLSTQEYKRTMESIFGFGLTLTTAKAEQTKVETSLIRKLMPADPNGPSGYTNDTSGNPISAKVLGDYSYLADVAITRLLSLEGRQALEAYCGPVRDGRLTPQQAAKLLDTFQARAWRRPVSDDDRTAHAKLVHDLSGEMMISALKHELKYVLMAPEFLCRGLLATNGSGASGPVDEFELAERLSYFLWADMPDDALIAAAVAGTLSQPKMLAAQVRRMLQSPSGVLFRGLRRSMAPARRAGHHQPRGAVRRGPQGPADRVPSRPDHSQPAAPGAAGLPHRIRERLSGVLLRSRSRQAPQNDPPNGGGTRGSTTHANRTAGDEGAWRAADHARHSGHEQRPDPARKVDAGADTSAAPGRAAAERPRSSRRRGGRRRSESSSPRTGPTRPAPPATTASIRSGSRSRLTTTLAVSGSRATSPRRRSGRRYPRKWTSSQLMTRMWMRRHAPVGGTLQGLLRVQRSADHEALATRRRNSYADPRLRPLPGAGSDGRTGRRGADSPALEARATWGDLIDGVVTSLPFREASYAVMAAVPKQP